MRISDWSSDVCSSDLLEIEGRIVLHAANDGGHFLLALRLDALDEVGAPLLIEERIFAVMPRPHSAARGIDKLMGARDDAARRQFGKPAFPARQHARTDARAPRRWGLRPREIGRAHV